MEVHLVVAKMKQIIYLLFFVLMFSLVTAVTIESETLFEPSNGGSFYVISDFEANEVIVNTNGTIINSSDNIAIRNDGTEGNLTIICPLDLATYTIKPNEEWEIDCGSDGSSLLQLSNTASENYNPYAGSYVGIGYVNITDYIINYYNLNQSLNFTENRTSSNYHLINLSNSATIKLNYNGRKIVGVENNSVNVSSLPTYNTYCNSTSAVCKQNQNNFTETIGTDGRVFVFGRTVEAEPHISELATTITEIDVSESAGTYTVDCTGTGVHKHDLSSYGAYYVYHEGEYLGPFTDGIYTATSCSVWQFIRTDAVENIPEADITIENTTDSLSKMVKMFAIIIGIIVAGFIIGSLINGSMDMDEFASKAFIILVTAIAIVFLLLLLNGW